MIWSDQTHIRAQAPSHLCPQHVGHSRCSVNVFKWTNGNKIAKSLQGHSCLNAVIHSFTARPSMACYVPCTGLQLAAFTSSDEGAENPSVTWFQQCPGKYLLYLTNRSKETMTARYTNKAVFQQQNLKFIKSLGNLNFILQLFDCCCFLKWSIAVRPEVTLNPPF